MLVSDFLRPKTPTLKKTLCQVLSGERQINIAGWLEAHVQSVARPWTSSKLLAPFPYAKEAPAETFTLAWDHA